MESKTTHHGERRKNISELESPDIVDPAAEMEPQKGKKVDSGEKVEASMVFAEPPIFKMSLLPETLGTLHPTKHLARKQPRLEDHLTGEQTMSRMPLPCEEVEEKQGSEKDGPGKSDRESDRKAEIYNNSEEYLSIVLKKKEKLSEEKLLPFSRLRKAIQEKDWKSVRAFIEENPEAINVEISEASETFFYLISQSDHDATTQLVIDFVPKFGVSILQDATGSTPLHYSASIDNRKAVEIYLQYYEDWPHIKDDTRLLPIHYAAGYGHEKTVRYLIPYFTRYPSDDDGVLLLVKLIQANLFGVALDLLVQNQNFGRQRNEDRKEILECLAKKPLGFKSGSRLGYWRWLIYHCTPVKVENFPSQTQNDDCLNRKSVDEDMEKAFETKKDEKKCKLYPLLETFGQLRHKLHFLVWDILKLVPSIKRIHDKKLMHMRAHEIVKIMCDREVWTYEEARVALKRPLLTAATWGISEFVNEIMKVYDNSIFFVNEKGNNVFQLAVLHRHEKVFNLIYKMGPLKEWMGRTDLDRDNILHLAGRLVPSSRVAGAAFQMQREIQWFKAVKKLLHPSMRDAQNSKNETPTQVFVEEHKTLVKDGEQWMKDTAQSCSVVAALIITIVFAAAITVPGGNNNGGEPAYLHEASFIVFAISDALALFSSTASLLMFLGILTARYSEEDFLRSLPKKLIIGLITLFFSIASMIVAFCATLYIVTFHPWKWTIIPISVRGCLPVTLFGLLQFRLLLDMLLSTYGRSIFRPEK